MASPLLTHSGELIAGEVVERPNRFVLRVDFGDGPEPVFLGDPGSLDVLKPGKTVLCDPVDDVDRATDYDAIAVAHGDIYVSLRAALANDLVAAAITGRRLPAFQDYAISEREPAYPDHGRADFLLDTPTGDAAYVEVKSCTHVEDGVAKFPDRPTERGRRHLNSLADIATADGEAHIAFVIQRPDATRLEPYRAVDPEFADRLAAAVAAGVEVTVIAVAFVPPEYHLHATDLPLHLQDGPRR